MNKEIFSKWMNESIQKCEAVLMNCRNYKHEELVALFYMLGIDKLNEKTPQSIEEFKTLFKENLDENLSEKIEVKKEFYDAQISSQNIIGVWGYDNENEKKLYYVDCIKIFGDIITFKELEENYSVETKITMLPFGEKMTNYLTISTAFEAKLYDCLFDLEVIFND